MRFALAILAFACFAVDAWSGSAADWFARGGACLALALVWGIERGVPTEEGGPADV